MSLATQLRDDFRTAIAHINGQVAHLEAAERLMQIGERRRTERSEKVPVEVLGFEYIDDSRGKGIMGRVQGVGDIYAVRILTYVPLGQGRRVYHCTCEDSKRRGREVGPCKHTLALARVWHTQLLFELTELATGLEPVMPQTWRGQLPTPVQEGQTTFDFAEPVLT